MGHSITKKFIIWTLLALLIPLGVGVTSVHHVISDQITQTKLNDLMNIIDAKYIHLLDVLKVQAGAVQNLAADEEVIKYAQSLIVCDPYHSL